MHTPPTPEQSNGETTLTTHQKCNGRRVAAPLKAYMEPLTCSNGPLFPYSGIFLIYNYGGPLDPSKHPTWWHCKFHRSRWLSMTGGYSFHIPESRAVSIELERLAQKQLRSAQALHVYPIHSSITRVPNKLAATNWVLNSHSSTFAVYSKHPVQR